MWMPIRLAHTISFPLMYSGPLSTLVISDLPRHSIIRFRLPTNRSAGSEKSTSGLNPSPALAPLVTRCNKAMARPPKGHSPSPAEIRTANITFRWVLITHKQTTSPAHGPQGLIQAAIYSSTGNPTDSENSQQSRRIGPPDVLPFRIQKSRNYGALLQPEPRWKSGPNSPAAQSAHSHRARNPAGPCPWPRCCV